MVGVVLTGNLDDGTAGLWAVRQQGGVAIVQHPEDAVAPSMPLNALKSVEVNHCVALAGIPPLLIQLARTPLPEPLPAHLPSALDVDLRIAAGDSALTSGITGWGKPSLYACPECHGVLLHRREGRIDRYRCHTGHGYSAESLLAHLIERTEEATWNAVRAFDESILLLQQVAAQREQAGHSDAAALRGRLRALAARREQVVATLGVKPESVMPAA